MNMNNARIVYNGKEITPEELRKLINQGTVFGKD